ncbi:MAG: XTP/dITP diphosphatase [Candidatus Rifleibacteriota bacterium]
MKTIWVATANPHKLEEIQQIIGDSIQLKSLRDLENPPEIIENGKTYLENAEIKARAVYQQVKEPVLADDSGLEVDALDGRPGIHSSRYSGPGATHEKNIEKLLNELANVPLEKRGARFRCVIVFIDQAGVSHSFEGVFPGYIGFEKSGSGGFGYDPVFFIKDKDCSVAELPTEEKNRISHRGLAMQKLKTFLNL